MLLNWGNWVNQNPLASLCYPTIEPFRRLITIPGEYRPEPANEISAKIADRLIEKLLRDDEHVGTVTALHFVTGMSHAELSRFVVKHANINADRKKVSSFVERGEAWIAGAYAGIEMME